VTLADLCVREDRWWKGAGVGLAAGIKLTPAIFIPYLLLTRRYRVALTATAAFGLTIAVSFAVLRAQARQYWLGELFLRQQRVGHPDALPDQSLDGMLTRLADPGHGSVWYAWLVAAAIVGTCGMLLAMMAYNRGFGLLGIVTCAVTGLLISPISWDHHWVWIVPLPLAALAAVREHGAWLRTTWTPGTFGAICLVALSALFLDYPIFSGAEVSTHGALDGLIWGTDPNAGHWHGLQLISGNLYVLAGLAILCSVALVISSYPTSRSPASPLR
jgi:alpha-1,2-mannosyltransferase